MVIESSSAAKNEIKEKNPEVQSLKEKIIDAYSLKWNAPLTKEQKDTLAAADLQTLDVRLFPGYSENDLKMLVGELVTLDTKTPQELKKIKETIKNTNDITIAFPLTTWINGVMQEMKLRSDALKEKLNAMDAEEIQIRAELDEVKETIAANMQKASPSGDAASTVDEQSPVVIQETVTTASEYMSPLKGLKKEQITKRFGPGHDGIDLEANYRTPIYAAYAGKVVNVGGNVSPFTGYGNHVMIEIAPDTYMLYGHMAVVPYFASPDVTLGQEIGRIGSTGKSTGSHLHLEVRKGKDREHKKSAEHPDGYVAVNPYTEYPGLFTETMLAKK